MAPWAFRHMAILSPWTLQYEDFLAQGIFGMWTFQHRDILAQRHCGIGIFWYKNISTHGRFGTGHFRYHTKQYGCLRTVIFAPMPKFTTVLKSPFFRNIQVFKCFSTEMSLCRKVPMPKGPHAKMSRCQKVLVQKSSHAG